jgi:hypothetical protein
MRTNMLNVLAVLIFSTSIFPMMGCVKQGSGSAASIRQENVDSLRNILDMTVQGRVALDNNLTKFDTLELKVLNNQDWAVLKESHAQDIMVTWPDGHKTTGLEKHIEDLKAMFTRTPDLRITTHPIRFGNASGEWTCVTGVMESKNLSVPICTIGKWKDGVMVEKYLFFDK